MKTILNISMILSFAGLWISSLFSSKLEIILGFILIFSFGILHGSNDILLINRISKDKIKYPFFKVLMSYLLTVLLAVIIFYFIPALALVLFIVFSAFHFGEQHWDYRKLNVPKTISNPYYFIYGLFVLQLLFILNVQDVIEIIEAVTTHQLSYTNLLYVFVASTTLFILYSIILYLRSKSFRKIILHELFYILVFAVIFKVSTLIWGFTIYFILWHSVPSIYEQVLFIYGNFNKKHVIQYCKKAVPYWSISLIGILVVYKIFNNQTIFYAIFFSFIAAITFPHAFVINKMFSNKKTQPN